MLPVIVEIILPLLAAGYLVTAHHSGGARRLWRDGALISVGVAGLAIWRRDVVYAPGEQMLGAYGLHLWPWAPLATVAAVLLIELLAHRRIPRLVRLLPAALASYIVLAFGTWIS